VRSPVRRWPLSARSAGRAAPDRDSRPRTPGALGYQHRHAAAAVARAAEARRAQASTRSTSCATRRRTSGSRPAPGTPSCRRRKLPRYYTSKTSDERRAAGGRRSGEDEARARGCGRAVMLAPQQAHGSSCCNSTSARPGCSTRASSRSGSICSPTMPLLHAAPQERPAPGSAPRADAARRSSAPEEDSPVSHLEGDREFADSPLEGDGFEPSVPQLGKHFFETTPEPGN
jgi:hypothetical protein